MMERRWVKGVHQDWSRFGQWHLLLDSLCGMRGHADNAGLASQLCRRLGKTAQEDFDTAEKNLRNWRLGRHAPLRRNFMVLSELLGVEEDPALVRHWNALYAAARGHRLHQPVETPAEPSAAMPGGRHRLAWAAGAAALVLLAAGGFRWLLAEPYGHLPLIGYNSRIVMALGESRLVHGDRGNCDGGMLPDWYYTSQRVPVSDLGTFSDGGLARKMSNFCNAVVPVRAVRFTARKAGEDEVRLLDDYVRIVVVDPSGSYRQQSSGG